MTASPSPGRSAQPSPWRGVDLLERAIGYTRGSLALVTPELMSADTPCAGWALRRLLLHMNDSLASLHEAGSVRRVRLAGRATPPTAPPDLVEALRSRACQLLAEWSAAEEGSRHGVRLDVLVGGRPVTVPVLTSAGALEVAVHGWDVAVACGARRPLPELLARDLLRLAPVLVTDADRPARFAPALNVSAEALAASRSEAMDASGEVLAASAGEPEAGDAASRRLLAFLGRDPGWQATGADGVDRSGAGAGEPG